ncbi:DUF1853 family protein [Psychrobacter sp. GP33]|uniref:DUF1853 family protein n=1 Tax=Psychrobacter sp. GP33 TaxID=2758709 RepID=UPI0015FE4CE4|nr:DUF1853 family protein [Psychrobacter sp. GP33]
MNEATALPLPTLSNHSNISDNAPWEQYQRPYVRDLAFALACPNVLTHWIDFTDHQNNDGSGGESAVNNTDKNTAKISVHSADFWHAQYKAYQGRLQILDSTNAYQALTRYLLARPSPNRLGFHFEGLLSFWITDGFAHGHHPYEILASNVQLYCGKQTSGELDLVLYNHQEKLTEHWELAIKFFMGSAPFAPVNWVGINPNDNLQRKMAHMQTKQFCTLAIDTKNHGEVKIDKRYALIKGRFFLPMTNNNFVYPDWFTPSFPLHRWLAAPSNQNNQADQISEIAQTDDITELLTDVVAIRQAHYIEWFTQRNFYNKEDNKVSPTIATLQQGLYFVQRSSQGGYEPVVILQTAVNAEQNSVKD